MTELKHTGGLKWAALFIAVLLAHSGVSSESAMQWYAVSSNNSFIFSSALPVDSGGVTNAALQIECPEDISTYTDINECTAEISNSLNVNVTSGRLAVLTWEMTGANNDASPRSGVNQIESYVFNEGTTTITYTAKDRFRNSFTCTFTVIVSDNQVPKLVSAPENITVATSENECGTFVSWDEPVVADNCTPSNQILKTSSHVSGTFFPLGTTTVTYIFDDGMAATQESYSFTVTVTDKTEPVLTAPENTTVNCGDVLPRIYTSFNEFMEAGGTATDNCTIKASSFVFISQTQSSTTCPYTITRTYQVSDVYNNIGKVEQHIFVKGEAISPQPENKPVTIIEPSAEPVVMLKSGMGIMASPEIFNTPGNHTFQVPLGVTSITIHCWGGGGAGGGSNATNAGGGGGGGAYNFATFTVTPGDFYTVTVGAGGAGGLNADGAAGNPSTVIRNIDLVTIITANGGAGGVRGSSGGAGGLGGVGGIYNGGAGGTGGASPANGAGGGGGAGDNGNGGNGSNISAGLGGAGSPNAGGNGGNFTNVTTVVNAGNFPGGGGSGAYRGGISSRAGGAGATGQVIITYISCIEPAITPMVTTICSGDLFTVTPTDGTDGVVPAGTTYTWTAPVSNPVGAVTGGSAQGTGQTSISQTLTNTTNASATLTYTVTPKSDDCIGDDFTVTITVNALSVAPTGITGTTTICAGSSTTLTVSGGTAGTGATTEWFTGSCGGTSAGTGSSITVSPASTTIYYVRYSGTCNTTTCATATVTVNTLSVAPTGITGTTTICAGSSTTLTVSGGTVGTGATTEWFTGSCGGTSAGTGNSITVSPASTTTYYVRYSGTCNTTTCATATVTVNTLSVAPTGITGTTTICAGSSTTLTVSGGTAGTGATTEWFTGSCGGTSAGTGSSITVSPASTTIYYVRYSGTCNTTTCATATVTVNTLSVAPTGITGTTTICAGSSTTLTVSGGTVGTGATTEWFTGSCGGTSAGTGNSITVSPASTTTYYVRYSGTCNTTTCATATVTVNTLSVAPTGITGTTTICAGSSTTLTVSGGTVGTGATTEWFTGSCGGTSAGTGNSITVSPASTTIYYVRYSGTCNTTTCATATVTVNTLSVAPTGITGTTTICAGSSTTLTVNGGTAGTGATVQWFTGSCGGTSAGTGNSITVSPASTTIYYVRYSGTCNTTTCATATVTVNTLSVAPTGITGTTTICAGSSTTLTVNGGTAGTGATVQWFTGSCGGTSAGTGNSITVSPASTTTYYVRYSGTCNTTTCATATVTVNTLSVAPTGITGTTTICGGSSTTLTVSGGTAGTGATVQWFTGSCGGTSAGTGNSITVSPASTTTYYVRYSGTCNTTTCATATVTVNTLSVAPTGITGTTTICAGSSTTLTVSGGTAGTGATVQWFTGSCGGTSAGTGNSITVSPGSTTTYYVRYSGTCNTTTCATATVTVNTLSVAPTGITGTTTICAGSSTTLTVSGGTAGTGATVQWFTGSCGGTSAGTGNSITVSPASTTTYYVRYSGTCNTTTCATTTVTVNTLSVAPTGITGTTTICAGSSTTLTVSGGTAGTGATVQWFTGSCGGTSAGTGNSITVSPASTTTYYVRYSGTCNTTTCATATVTVNTLSVAPTGITGTTTICAGSSTTLTVSGGTAGTGATVQWFTGSCGGTSAGTGNSITVSPASTTTYYVRYSGTCNTTTCATATVTVNLATGPTTFTAGAITVCQNAVDETYTATAANSTSIVYSVLPAGAGTINSSTGVMNWDAAFSGPATVTATSTGLCGTTSANRIVTVTPTNTITLTSAGGTNNQTRCINTAILVITYATTGASGATFSGLPAGVTGSWAANVVTISGTPTASGPFNYTITLTGGCGNITENGTIIVTPDNTRTLTSAVGTNAQTKCVNTPITNITYSTTGATGVTFTGLPPGVTGSWAADVVTISGTPTSDGFFGYIGTLTGGCGAVTVSGSITVTPDNTITLTSAAGTDAQNSCIGIPIINITYSTTGATGATFSGLPAGVTGSFSAGNITISGTPTASGNFSYTINLTGGCPTVNTTGTITVNPIPQGSLSANGPFCDTGAGQLTFTASSGTGPFSVVYKENGGADRTASGVVSGIIFPVFTTPVTGTTIYTLVSVTDADGCSRNSGFTGGSATINVNSAPAITTHPVSQQICLNSPVTFTVIVTGTPAPTFQWRKDGSDIPGATSSSLTINPVLAVNAGSYDVVVSNSCGTVTSNPAVLTVSSNPVITLHPVSQTGCIGESVLFTAAATGGFGPLSYTWYLMRPSGSWVTASGQSGISFPTPDQMLVSAIGNISNPTGTQYRVNVSNVCGNSIASNIATLTVDPVPVINAITSATCSNVGFTVSPVTGTNGTVPAGTTYTWSAPVVTGGLTGGAAGTDASNISGTLTNTTNTAHTATYTITPKSASCTGNPFTLTVTVNPVPDITAMTTATCSGVGFSVTPVNGTNGLIPAGTTYTWPLPVVTGGLTGGAAGTAVTNISGTLTNPTNTAQTATYTVTPTSGACSGASFTVTVTVAPSATVDAGPAITSICQGQSTVPLVGTIGGSATGAVWSSSVGGGTFSPSANYTDNPVWTPPASYKGNVTFTLTTSGPCASVSASKSITVFEQPAIVVQPVSQTDCYERVVDFNVVATGAGLTYNWLRYRPLPSADGGFIAIPVGAPNVSYPTPGTIRLDNVGDNTNNPDGTQYKVVVTNGSCSVESNPVTLTVNRITAVNNSTSPSNALIVTLCNGSNFSYTVTTNHPENILSYQWKKSVVSGVWVNVTNSAIVTGANAAQLIFTGATPAESAKYKVTIGFSSSSAGGCTVTSDNFDRTLTILPAVAPTVVTGPQTICYNTQPAQLTTTAGSGGTGTGYAYQWQRSTDNSNWTNVGTNALTYQPPVLTSNTWYRVIVTDTDPANSCGSATSASVLITVEAAPTATAGGTQTVCTNKPAIVSGLATDYSSILWTITTGTGTLTNETTLNPTYTPSPVDAGTTVILTMTVTGNNTCGALTASATYTVNVTVLPSATISYPAFDYCTDAGNIPVTRTGTPGGTYTVSPAGLSINSATGEINTVLSTPGLYTITYTIPASATCEPVTTTTTITINELPLAQTGPGGNICVGQNVTIGVAPIAGHTYSWASVPVGISSTLSQINVAPAVNTTYYLTETITATGCSKTNSVIVTTDQNIDVTITPDNLIICSGEVTAIALSSNYLNAVFTWTATLTGTNTTGFGPGTGTVINQTLINNGAASEVVRYNITATVGTCFNNSEFIDVTVYPAAAIPTITAGATAFCQGGSVILTSSASSGYQWKKDGVAISGETDQTFTATTGGSYTVEITDANGCKATSAATVVTVNPLPDASVSGTTAVCLNAAEPVITFTGSNGTAPYTFTYNINGGAVQTVTTTVGNSITVSVPTATSGVFNYNLLSVQDAGSTTCSQVVSGTATITVNTLPTATISGNANVCQDASTPLITFTGANGTAPYTFTYNINGGPDQTVTTISGNSITVSAPTGVAGTFVWNLVSVAGANGCFNNATGTATVTVNPLTTANISGTNSVCLNDINPIITFTGNGGTAPYTFTYKINGGADQSVTTVSGNSVDVTVPTGTVGIFNYSLVSVTGTGTTVCNTPATGSATITVKPLPSATISGVATVCVGEESPVILFTGSGGTLPYTFTYKINGGANQTVSTSGGSTVVIFAPTNVAGTFNYTLVSVKDAGVNGCISNLVSGTATITVNPKPAVTITATKTELCPNEASPVITITATGGTRPYTFTYNINSGPFQTLTTPPGLDYVTLSAPTGTAGTFVYKLESVSDASVTSCLTTLTNTLIITVNALPLAPAPNNNLNVCYDGLVHSASATPGVNESIIWYNAPTGGTVTTAPTGIAVGTYTAYAAAKNNLTGCEGVDRTLVTLSINSLPTVVSPGDQMFCFGMATTPVALSGFPANVVFDITGGALIGLANVTGVTEVPSFVPTSVNSATITVTPRDIYNCTGVPVTFIATVRPAPTATINSGGAVVCKNGVPPSVTFSNPMPFPVEVTYNINGGPNLFININSNTSIPIFAATDQAGIFNYNLVSVKYQSSPFCSAAITGTATVTVLDSPTATISGTASVCQDDVALVTFSNPNALPVTVTYNINGVNPATININGNSTATVIAATSVTGIYAYNLVSVAFQSGTSCLNNIFGTATITVLPKPIVTISSDQTVCRNTPSVIVTVTNPQSIPVRINYTINNVPQLPSVNIGAGSTTNFSVNTSTTGSFIYKITTVQYNAPSVPTCLNVVSISSTVNVLAPPTASVSGSTSVCFNGTSPLVTFTNPQALPITVTYNINGLNPTTIDIPASTTAQLAVPTSVAGTFIYNLVSAVYQGANPCPNPIASQSATVTVRPAPIVSISGTNTVCQFASPSPNITVINPQTLPVTVTYKINNGSSLTANIPASSSTLISVPTAIAGSFLYELVSVQYQTAPNCSNIVTGSATVNVLAAPTATISGTTAVCQGFTPEPVITITNPQNSPITVVYNIGGVNPTTLNINANSSLTVTAPTNVPGVFNYNLVSVAYQTGPACINTTTGGFATVTVNAVPAAPTAGNNGPVCVGSPLSLTATTIAGASYNWTGPNGFTSTVQNPVVSVSATTLMSGTYSVIATLNGCSSPAGTTTVTVNSIPAAPVAGNNGPVCLGSLLSLTASNIAGANYSWTGPNGFTSLVQNPTVSANATAAMAGTYIVTAFVNNCASLTATTVVSFIQSPVIGNYVITICDGSNFIISPEDGVPAGTIVPAGTTYSWAAPTGTGFTGGSIQSNQLSVSQTLTLTNPAVGATATYTVIPRANGCNGIPFTVTVTVSPKPRPINVSWYQLDYTTNYWEQCAGQSGELIQNDLDLWVRNAANTAWIIATTPGTLTGYDNIGWEYSYNDLVSWGPSPVAYSNNYQHVMPPSPSIFTRLGVHYFRFQLTKDGCTTYSDTITMKMTSTLVVDPGEPLYMDCVASPSPIQLTGASVTGNPNPCGTWTIESLEPTNGGVNGTLSSGACTSTPDQVTYTPPAGYAGTVTLRLTTNDPDLAAGPCAATYDFKTITINPVAGASAGNPQSTCTGGTVVLEGSVFGTATGGVWSAASGTFSNVNSLTSTYTPSITSGTVTLTLTPNVTGGCVQPSTVDITVNPALVTTGVNICQGGTGSLSSTSCPSLPTITTNPRYPATGANITGVGGTNSWTGFTNIYTNNNGYATRALTQNQVSNYLRATNFGFNIPAGATINGIVVRIGRFSNGGSNPRIRDNIVRLVQGGVIGGNNNAATTTDWPTAETIYLYGSNTDLWNLAWTPAQINNANFGVALSVTNTNAASRTASVDYITIEVFYSTNGVINWYTSQVGGTPIGTGTPFNPVGVAGSGLPNTNTPGTTTYYAECTTYPGCRTATNFVINTTPTVTKPNDLTTSACAYANQTALNTAFATWLAGFTVSGGTNPVGSFQGGITPTPPTLCSGGAVTAIYNYTDICGGVPVNGSVSATFTVTAPPVLTMSVPLDVNKLSCDFANQAAVNAAFATWLASFVPAGGCNPVGTFQGGTPTAPDLCIGGTVTATYNYTDNCGNGSATATFTINSSNAVVLSQPLSVIKETCNFADQSAVNADFATWLTGFTIVSSGCAGSASYGTPTAPLLCAGGTTEVTFLYTDVCIIKFVTASYTITAPGELIVNKPVDLTVESCDFADQAAVDAAFATWLSGFTVSGGCGGSGSLSTTTAPVLCDGGTVNVTYTYTDKCETKTESASFILDNVASSIVINSPANVDDPGCFYTSQLDLNQFFADWLTGFSVSGGCNPVGLINGTPSAPDLCTGGTTTVIYNVTDVCGYTGTITRTFKITKPADLVITKPASFTATPCNYIDQADLNSAFQTWLNGFTVSGGCTPAASYGNPVVPSLCDGGSVTVTYTVTDQCVSSSESATFTVEKPAPIAVVPLAEHFEPSCMSQAAIDAAFATWIAGFSYTGGCHVSPPSLGSYSPPSACGGSVTVNYTFYDYCGLSASGSAVFTVQSDLVKPQVTGITNIPDLGCNPVDPTTAFVPPSATDNCGIPTIKNGYPLTSTPTSTNCHFTQTRTWIFVDACNNESDPFIQIVSWSADNQKPVATGQTTIPNLGCNPADPIAAFVQPIATDNCGTPGIKIGYPQTSNIIINGCVYTRTRTWVFIDICNNESDPFIQTVSWVVDDNQKPVVTGQTTISNLGCNLADPTTAFVVPTATDNCGIPTIKTGYPQTGTVSTINCLSTLTRTWVFVDACNNESDPFTQTISWTTDIQVPVIATTATNNQNLGCNPTVTAPAFTVTDNCSVTGPIDVQTSGPVATTGCGWSQTWTASVSDDCSNPAVPVSITYTWTQDNEVPVITTIAINNEDLGCNPLVTAPVFTITGNCTVTNPIDVQSTGPVATTGCGWSQTWTANVSDDCNNPAAPVSITYTWTQDNEAPVISTTAVSGPLAGCNPTVTDPTFTGLDNCEGVFTPVVTTTGPTNTGCAYSQTWTANYTDACGNAAIPVVITYAWTQDNTAPVITTTAVSGPLAGCNPIVTAPVFTGTDNCEGTITPVVTTTGPTNTGCAYTQTWDANYTDVCGNAATQVSITYTWTQDTEIPVISTTAVSGALAGCNPTVTDPTFTGLDNCEGVFTPVVTTTGPTNSGCAYSQTWTANYTDACGNAAIPVVITYSWTQDNTAPVITTTAVSGPLAGCNPIVTAPVFTGTDNCEGTITPVVTTTGPTNTGCAYTQTWDANYTDVCGNAATQVSITYTWTQDTEIPVISTTAVSGALAGCNPTITDPTFTGLDNCEGAFTPVVTTTGPTNTGCAYTQTWTASYTDACGNAAIPVVITYSWTQDNTAPVITTTAVSGPLTGCNPIVTAPVFTGTDNCEGTITPVVTTTGPTNTGCAYTQTWDANYTDVCGNAATQVSITYTWTQDTEIPVISTTAVSGALAGCNPTVTDPTFTGLDNCEGVFTPVVTTTGPTNSGCAYSQTWTASYTDACGNAAIPVAITYSWTQDNTAPVITCPVPNTVTLNPDAGETFASNVPVPTPVVSDNCSGAPVLTWSSSDVSQGAGNSPFPVVNTFQPGTTTITWTATDACGNSATCSYQVIVLGTADISVTKTDSPDPVTAGDNITYTITVSNLGPAVAQTVTLTDAVPGTVSNLQFTLNGVPQGVWTGSLVFSNMAFNETQNIIITGKADCTATGTITNTALVELAPPLTDPVTGNNSATTTTTVNPLLPPVPGSYGPVCSDDADIPLVGSPAGGVWSGTGVSGSQLAGYVFDPSVGTQTLTYTYTDSNGCSISATTTINVNPSPAPSLIYHN